MQDSPQNVCRTWQEPTIPSSTFYSTEFFCSRLSRSSRLKLVGQVVRSFDLKSGDPEFKSSSEH